MSDINDTQINPEVVSYIEHELSCPFCEGNFFSVETIISKDNTCDHYECSCGECWEGIDR
jgi:hypothetical protein